MNNTNEVKLKYNPNKKSASSLKIYIKANNFKLNLIPIPFFLAKAVISFIFFIISFKRDNQQFSKTDIKEIKKFIKFSIRYVKNCPPFIIALIENNETSIYIYTK